MDTPKLVALIIIALIVVIAIWKYKQKSSGFKIVSSANSILPRDPADQPLGDLGGSVSSLGGHHFRGGYAGMVDSGDVAPARSDFKIPDMPTVQDMMPDGMVVGNRHTSPFEMKVATVQLRDRATCSDLSTMLSMIGQEPIHPVNSVHSIHDRDYYFATGLKFQLPGQPAFDPSTAVMELERV